MEAESCVDFFSSYKTKYCDCEYTEKIRIQAFLWFWIQTLPFYDKNRKKLSLIIKMQ
jgi:hypothetical protein